MCYVLLRIRITLEIRRHMPRTAGATVAKLRAIHGFLTSRTWTARVVRCANLRVSRVLDAIGCAAHDVAMRESWNAIFVYGA